MVILIVFPRAWVTKTEICRGLSLVRTYVVSWRTGDPSEYISSAHQDVDSLC